MLRRHAELGLGGAIGGQLARDKPARREPEPLHELDGGGRVPAGLDQDVEHLPFVVDRAP